MNIINVLFSIIIGVIIYYILINIIHFGSKEALFLSSIITLFIMIGNLLLLSRFSDVSNKSITTKNENIIYKTKANHINKYSCEAGKILLTKDKIIFKPFKFKHNILELKIAEIKSIKLEKSFGFLINKLVIKMNNNKTEKFIIDQIKPIYEAIQKSIEK